MVNFQQKKIAVLGYGVEGESLVSFLMKQKPKIIDIYDEKEKQNIPKDNAVTFRTVNFSDLDLSDYDLVFRSPGIKSDKLTIEKEKISSLTNLFFSLAKGKIVAVTGTKGKSTTALLIEQILQQNSKNVFVGGNIGKTPLEFLDKLDSESYSVLELSSFQLADLKTPPSVAVILPIFQDHLDYHEDFEEYVTAKRNVFSLSKKVTVISAKSNRDLLKLSTVGNPLYEYDDNRFAPEVIELSRTCQIPAVDIACAVEFAKAENLTVDLKKLSSEFQKLPFRVEKIDEIDGVVFYNDSAATNPISTGQAINLINGRKALIIGGRSKGIAIKGLCEQISNDDLIISVYLYGEEAENFKKILSESSYDRKITTVKTLDEVFAALELEDVDNVLFSPAYASFDQYNSYKERGQHFNKLVRILKCQDI